MPPFRYLIHFSYIGSRYSGVAEQLPQKHVQTISQSILKSFEKLKSQPKLCSALYISSRTDAGVHALHNTANIDLDHEPSKKIYHSNYDSEADRKLCDELRWELNEHLHKNDDLIKILKIQKVNPKFSARYKAQSRTYLFRLALDNESKKNYKEFQKELNKFNSTSKSKLALNKPQCKSWHFLSAFESQLYTPIYEPFDYELFLKAVELVRGQHNFSAFTTTQGRLDLIKHNRNPVKTLRIQVNLNESENFLDFIYPEKQLRFKCIELEITAESFLYKMIRKIVGSLVGVSSGKLTLDDLNRMMLCPPDYYDNSVLNIITARPNGLILKSVNYNKSDLVYDHAQYEKLSILLN